MKQLVLLMMLILFSVSGCGYNAIQEQDEAVSAAHAQMLSVYKKRFDLVPNLVEVVKAYAVHEETVFTEVAEARSKTGQVNLPVNASSEQMKSFLDDQKLLSSSLSRLIVVAENYPQLKADSGFRDLQRQLDEIETQATAVRNRYIRSIQTYNKTIRKIPVNVTAWIFGYHRKPQMQFEDGESIKNAPQVRF